MKITNFHAATVLIEHNGIKVLCDPWFTQGAYYGSWYLPPGPAVDMKLLEDIDYVYITHVHPDHFDTKYLSTLDKNIGIIICEYEEKYLRKQIEALGFRRIIELPSQATFPLGDDFWMEMYAADNVNADLFGMVYRCKPIAGYRRTLQIDSLAVFTGGGRVVVNLNDVPQGLAQIPVQIIRNKYKHIDAALVSYAGAGPYPQAYDISQEEKEDARVGVAIRYLSTTTFELLKHLNPSVYIPFAGGYVLGGRNVGMNEYKAVAELDDLQDQLVPVIRQGGLYGEMLILDRGGTYDVSHGGFTKQFKATDFQARKDFIKSLAEKPFDFDGDDTPGDLTDAVNAAYPQLLAKQKRYDFYSNWNLYADTGDQMFRIGFDGNGAHRVEAFDSRSPYLHAKIDKKLFARILNRRANWNNAEVGSHVILRPCVPPGVKAYEPMIHHLMAYFQGSFK